MPAAYFCIKAFSETDFTEDLKAFDVQTLILHGDDDQIVPQASDVGAMAQVHGRLVGATEAEIEAAVDTVVAALAHPVMRRAASVAVSDLRRETPIFLRREDGTFLEGVVDLAFREERGESTEWKVVDFRTDRELELRRAEYTAQGALYAQAIEKATNSLVSGILLVI